MARVSSATTRTVTIVFAGSSETFFAADDFCLRGLGDEGIHWFEPGLT